MSKLKALYSLLEDTQYKLQNDMAWLEELENTEANDPDKIKNLGYVNGLINARLDLIKELQYLAN